MENKNNKQFKEFDKVVVYEPENDDWFPTLYSKHYPGYSAPHRMVDGKFYKECISYSEYKRLKNQKNKSNENIKVPVRIDNIEKYIFKLVYNNSMNHIVEIVYTFLCTYRNQALCCDYRCKNPVISPNYCKYSCDQFYKLINEIVEDIKYTENYFKKDISLLDYYIYIDDKNRIRYGLG